MMIHVLQILPAPVDSWTPPDDVAPIVHWVLSQKALMATLGIHRPFYTVEYNAVMYPTPPTAAVEVAVSTMSNEQPLEKNIPMGLKLASINGFETSPPPVKEVELDCIPSGRIPRTLEFISTFEVVLL